MARSLSAWVGISERRARDVERGTPVWIGFSMSERQRGRKFSEGYFEREQER
jgi:hypothetical protein